MEVRFTNVDNNYKDLANRQQWRQLHVNIALADKSSAHGLAVLYVLKRDIIDADLTDGRLKIDGYVGKDPLVPLGPTLAIDRHHKRIYLADNTVVTYNHLIAFSTPRFSSPSTSHVDELSLNAVQALIDAMRCLTIRPGRMNDYVKPAQRTCVAQTAHATPDLVHHFSHPPERNDMPWIARDRTLFEVQT